MASAGPMRWVRGGVDLAEGAIMKLGRRGAGSQPRAEAGRRPERELGGAGKGAGRRKTRDEGSCTATAATNREGGLAICRAAKPAGGEGRVREGAV